MQLNTNNPAFYGTQGLMATTSCISVEAKPLCCIFYGGVLTSVDSENERLFGASVPDAHHLVFLVCSAPCIKCTASILTDVVLHSINAGAHEARE